MAVRLLGHNQTHDPARGSFMVNAMPIKGKRWNGKRVYFSCAHIALGGGKHLHPDGYEYAVNQDG